MHAGDWVAQRQMQQQIADLEQLRQAALAIWFEYCQGQFEDKPAHAALWKALGDSLGNPDLPNGAPG